MPSLEKAFGKETVLTASIPQKPLALSSAVCSINIDQRIWENSSVGHNNDSPTYVIHNHTTKTSSKRSELSCCEKKKPPSSIVVDDINKRSKSSDHLENICDGIKNVKTTDSDNVGDDDVNRGDTLTLRFIEKGNDGDLAGEKNTGGNSQQKSD